MSGRRSGRSAGDDARRRKEARKRARRTAKRERVLALQRPISETIADFGEPVLARLEGEVPIEVLRAAFQTIITVWNAQVLALPEWGEPQHRDSLRDLLSGADGEMVSLVEELALRRRARFAHDPRAVGDWEIAQTDDGFRLRCDARLPAKP